MDKQGRTWSSFKDVEDFREANGEDGLSKLYEGMFPLSEDYPMDRCMRVEPHQQDTGGFFITVLEKKTEIRARPEPAKIGNPIRPEAGAKDMTTDPEKPVPSITAVVDELMNGDQKNGGLDHIKALDAIAPPTGVPGENSNPSAAASLNTPIKRPAEEDIEATLPVKRVKTGEDVDSNAATTATVGERLEHFPGPPVNRAAHEASQAAQAEAKELRGESHEAKPKKSQQQFEEPFKFLKSDQPDLGTIFENYEINPRFPRDRFMVRNAAGEPARTVYYTSALARDILIENEGKGLKFVHCGIKMFVKQDIQREDQCPWRIQTDGLALLEPWISEKRIVKLNSRKTLFKLLKEMFPKVSGGSWEDLAEIGERVRDMELGCSVLRVEVGEGEDSFKERMVSHLVPLARVAGY